ncbi:hypothetical protein [Scytonema hofmannii]|uniref:hypothetical protein n=1 Tax=Scytonema hofmannii TaxID=34078 RepID=UPI0013142698|nr:hypothetical protein [Scytonema hofmannii]
MANIVKQPCDEAVIPVRSLIFEGREELIPDWVRFQYDYGSAKTSPCNTWGSREGLTV